LRAIRTFAKKGLPLRRGAVERPLRSPGANDTMAVHPSTKLGRDVRIYGPDLVNIYGAEIGDETRIGPFVEIQAGARIGARCKIQSHTFIPEGVTIEDEVFVGHGVMFTNDLWPRAVDESGRMIGADGWTLSRTLVKLRASIGSGVVLLPVVVGTGALVGAGAVVTKEVPDYAIVAGNPARVVGDVRDKRKGSGADWKNND
jgi:UDP-2-acetamido-3-amino-2,3-dideoxy-glucuronate N-acetyltransferase